MSKQKVKLMLPYQKRDNKKFQNDDSKIEKREFWHDLIFTTIRNILSACMVGALGLAILAYAIKASLSVPMAIWYGIVGLALTLMSVFLVAWPMLYSGMRFQSRNKSYYNKVKYLKFVSIVMYVSIIYFILVPVLDVSFQTAIDNIKTKVKQETTIEEQEKKLDKIILMLSAKIEKSEIPELKQAVIGKK